MIQNFTEITLEYSLSGFVVLSMLNYCRYRFRCIDIIFFIFKLKIAKVLLKFGVSCSKY